MGGTAIPEYMTSGDVARLLGVNVGTVTRWAKEGRIPHVMTFGGKRRYRSDDIESVRRTLGHPDTLAGGAA